MSLEADHVFCGACDLADYAVGADDDTLSSVSFLQAAGGGAPKEETASSGKKDRPDKGDKQKCKCCQKWFLKEECGLNSPYCKRDKQSIDNLANQAAKQGETVWFAGVRRDEVQLRKLVVKYNDACPAEKTKSKRGIFLFVRYREEYKAESSVIVRDCGTMMSKRQYVEWAGTAAAGNMSLEEANKKWSESESDSGVPRDLKGPAKAALRLLMVTDNQVDFESAVKHAKVQMLSVAKDGKNVSEEDVANQRRDLLRGHSRGPGNDGEADFGSIASAMLANGSGGLGGGAVQSAGAAFIGAGVFVPDVKALAEDEDVAGEDPSARGAPQGAARTEASKGMPAPAPEQARAGKRAKWFDAANAVSKAKRTATMAREKVFDAVRDAEAVLSACVADLVALPAGTQAELASELSTGRHRLEFLKAVTAPEEDPPASGATARSLATLQGEVESGTKRAPCDDWPNLMTLTKAAILEQQVFAALEVAQNMEEARPTLRAHHKRR